jgi:hypothetical protein
MRQLTLINILHQMPLRRTFLSITLLIRLIKDLRLPGFLRTGAFHTEIFQKEIDNKNQKPSFSEVHAQCQNGLIERSNGTPCEAALSMFNHTVSNWDKTTTPELWHFTIQDVATIFNTTKRRSRNYEESP